MNQRHSWEGFQSCSHSRKPDLPVTQHLPSSTWLSVLFHFFSSFPLFFFSPAKTTLLGQGYGFSWWRRYIATVSALLLYSYCCINIFIAYGYSKLYSCLRLRFPDVETNPGPRRPVAASCRILCGNVRGLSVNLSDLALASSQYDIL